MQEQTNHHGRTNGKNGHSYPSRLILKSNGRLKFVDAEEIDWIQAMDVYVRLHSGDKSHLVRERLKNVEEKLDPNQFMRIHRSTIVNVERIREVTPHPYGGAMAVLHDGTKLRVSRTYRTRLTPTFG